MQILARDRFDRSLGRGNGREVALAAQQPFELARLDARRAVVAPLHDLQRLVLGELQPVFGEAGMAQHVGEHRQARVDIPAQAVERCAALHAADRGRDLRRQKGRLLVEHRRRLGFRAAGAHLRARQLRQSLLARRIQILAGAHQHGDVDQREFVVLDQVRHAAGRELVPVIGRARRREGERREFQIARMLRNLGAPRARQRQQ